VAGLADAPFSNAPATASPLVFTLKTAKHFARLRNISADWTLGHISKTQEEMMDNSKHASLVSSSDVNGTVVYGKDGSNIGSIDHLMIDKQSGKVAYAVMGFGGFLGMGEEHHPVPWNKLTFDPSRDGFVTDITETEVKGAPERTEGWHDNRDWETRMHDHYLVPHYWV